MRVERRTDGGWNGAAIIVSLVMLAAWSSVFLKRSLRATAFFDGPSADGPFQLYNALRRIADGQQPGVDFPLFHGAAIPYVHYPLYAIFGSDIFASEYARTLVSLYGHPVTLALFFFAFTRRWGVSLVMTTLAVALMLPLRELYLPENSLAGLRSYAPLLAVAAMMARGSIFKRAALIGGALGGSLLLGIEQGMAMLAAFCVTMVGAAVTQRGAGRSRALGELTIGGIIAIAVALLALLAIGGPAGAMETLRFQLKYAPGDQIWYFGVPPNRFLSDWSDLRILPRVLLSFGVSLLLIGALAWRSAASRRPSRRTLALLMLLLYGCASCASFLGMIVPHYGTPLHRSVILALLVLAYAFLRTHPALWRGPVRRLSTPRVQLAARVTVCLVVLAGVGLAMPRFVEAARLAKTAGLSPRFAHDIALQERTLREFPPLHQPARTWATFAGMFHGLHGTFQPAPDYIIHALGERARRRYVRDFDEFNPDIVQTQLGSGRGGFPYEEWLQNTAWPFYENLLSRYTVARVLTQSVLWRRRAPDEPLTVGPREAVLPLASSDGAFTLPVAKPDSDITLHVVDIEYEAKNTSKLPIAKSVPRYFIRIDNALNNFPVSLNPATRYASFPVYAEPGQRPGFHTDVRSLIPGGTLKIIRAHVHTIALTGSDTILVPRIKLRWLEGASPADIEKAGSR